MAKSYRVAVIGRTGKGNYGHGLDVVWKAIDNVEIVAVADEDEKGRAVAAKRLGARQAYADYRQMLEKERPQIVSVAVRWLDPHRDMVVACARAGASIFLEKPMARTLAEADEMVRACEMHHVKLAIAHQTRYSPRLRAVRELIAAGRLGELVELRGRGKEDQRGGGEDMMVLGTHIFDLMRLLAGDARWCHSRILQGGRLATKGDVHEGGEGMGPIVGDNIHATYGFDNGVIGTFGTQRAKDGISARFGLQVFGTKGILQFTTDSPTPVYFLEDPSWFPGKSQKPWQPLTASSPGQPEPPQEAGQAQGNQRIVRDLIESIEQDRQPLGNMYDGRAALEMIMAAYESHRIHGSVDLPLKNRRHPLATW